MGWNPSALIMFYTWVAEGDELALLGYLDATEEMGRKNTRENCETVLRELRQYSHLVTACRDRLEQLRKEGVG